VTDKIEILSWSTAPFEQPAEMIGTGAAHLFVEVDQPDTNFIPVTHKIYRDAAHPSRLVLPTRRALGCCEIELSGDTEPEGYTASNGDWM